MYWRIFTMTENKTVLAWLEEMKAMCQPDNVVWIDGSEEQLEALRAEAVATGEMIKLNQEKLPGCYYHRTAENDEAKETIYRFNEGQNNVCYPLFNGSYRFTFLKDRYRAFRQYLCCT